jgi:hypothetical protein
MVAPNGTNGGCRRFFPINARYGRPVKSTLNPGYSSVKM